MAKNAENYVKILMDAVRVAIRLEDDGDRLVSLYNMRNMDVTQSPFVD
jgi:hypothetical protein